MNTHPSSYLSMTIRFQVTKKILEIIFKYTYHKAQLLLKSLFINLYLAYIYLIYLLITIVFRLLMKISLDFEQVTMFFFFF